jgi:6-hydroxycyclohex-1-ene-1-carbonyl-CoA dehydrogenase
MPIRRGWRMVGPGRLEAFEDVLAATPPGWATVEVLGCGVCHTDVGYLYDGVAPAAPLPLVLGHEIVGRVGGRVVVVPAVSPCGDCAACRRERLTACRAGKMPGYHHDGGFATHVQVPEAWLCDVPPLPPGLEVWQLAAVADALSTAYQALVRACFGRGDTAVVVGAGGVGGFLLELARARQGRAIAVDVAPAALARAAERGAITIDARGLEPRAVKQAAVEAARKLRADADGWHVFECSGSPRGQETAFALLTRGATLSIVGFTAAAVSLRLSNVMALDAEVYGNWGCDPRLLPELLDRCAAGEVDLAAAVERHPLSDAPAVLAAAHRGELARRAVLVPT